MTSPMLAAALQTFRYDPLDRVYETTSQAGLHSRRFYRGAAVAALVQADTHVRYLREANSLLAIHKKLEVQLPATDQQGSVLLAGSAKANQQLTYTGHGYSPTVKALGFCGELNDSITGCYLLGNGYRAYHPASMRFRSPDSYSPFGAGGINPYAYCTGDPINRSDPTGHFDWMHINMIVFTTIGVLATVGSRGIAKPAFSALWALMTGSPVVPASVTAASVYAAVSVTTGATSGMLQIASFSMQGAANGDPDLIKSARLISAVGSVIGGVAAVTGAKARALAYKTMRERKRQLALLEAAQVSRQGSIQSLNARPTPAETVNENIPMSTRSVTSRPASAASVMQPGSPRLRSIPEALDVDTVQQDVHSMAARLRGVARSRWTQRDMANLLNRIEESMV